MVRPLREMAALLAILGLLVACGGTEFSAGSDAGSDATATGDAATACVIVPPATGDEGDFCSTETKLYDRCQQCDACHQADLNNCEALGDSLSAAFKSALDACVDQIACGGFSTYAGDPCVSAALTAATPTMAQQSAKTAYCTRCPTDLTECANYFNPPSDGGGAGLGFVVLLSSDAVATDIAATCGTQCTALGYETCVIDAFCKSQSPDACSTGYCGKQ